jgi:hypothetical protein
METWKMSKNKTIFIIGSGPSLKQIDMSLLKDKDTFSMNRQYIAYEDWGFYPTYYAMIDRNLIKTVFADDVEPNMINNDKCSISKYIFSSNYQSGLTNLDKYQEPPFDCKTNVMVVERLSSAFTEEKLEFLNNRENNKFSILEGKPIVHSAAYGNCGVFAIAMSVLMGYERVVLLGVDLKYVDWKESVESGEDLSHFHPKYFDVETFNESKTHGPPSHENISTEPWEKTISLLNETFSEVGLIPPEVVSATPDSPLNSVFKYIPFDEIIREENED